MHFAVFIDLTVNFNQQILVFQGGNMVMKIVIGRCLCHVALQSKLIWQVFTGCAITSQHRKVERGGKADVIKLP